MESHSDAELGVCEMINTLAHFKERGCYGIKCEQCPLRNERNSTAQNTLCHDLNVIRCRRK